MTLGEPTQVQQEEPQPVGIEPSDSAAAAELVRTPMWRVRLRLFRRSFARNWALFRENKMGMFGLVLIGIFALMAIIHPILMSTVWDPKVYDPVTGYDAVLTEYEVVEEVTDPTTQIEVSEARIKLNPTIKVGDTVRIPAQPAPPTWTGENPHYLGTDPQGRDILSQLLYSTRAAFFLGAVAALTTVIIATTVGSVAA